MRLRQIEIFHAVYTTGSITSAAKILYVSQPSVSKVLAHAELQLGFQLFTRTKGKLIPTNEANQLFTEVDKIHKQLNSIKKLSTNIRRSEQGYIDLAITPALGFDVLPKAIARFCVDYPDVQIKLRTIHNDEALESLLEHKSDVAILYSSPPMPGVKEIHLANSEVVVCYPKQRFPDQPQSMSLTTLANHNLIGIWDSGPIGEMVWDKLNESDQYFSSMLQVDTYYIAARLVDKSVGCCTVDRFTAEGNKTENVGIASFEPKMKFSVKALHLDSRPLSRNCELFLTYLKQEM
jgi:DNA-binding transcriptional LysR family regulator